MSDVPEADQGLASRARRGKSMASRVKNGKDIHASDLKNPAFSSTQKHNPLGVFSHYGHFPDEYDNKQDVRRVFNSSLICRWRELNLNPKYCVGPLEFKPRFIDRFNLTEQCTIIHSSQM